MISDIRRRLLRSQRLRRLLRQPAWWMGIAIGAGVTWMVREVPYVNWRAIVPPVGEHPILVRQDAKGDGRFLAPRSGNRRHGGIDLVAPLGSPVGAIRSGTVMQVGTHRGLGRFVELQHPGGLTSLYAHLDTIRVEVNARVRQGEAIGTVGKSGNARHPWIASHVHLEVARAGVRIDPTSLGLEVVAASELEPQTESRGGE